MIQLTPLEFYCLHICSTSYSKVSMLPYNSEKLLELRLVERQDGYFKPTSKGYEYLQALPDEPAINLPISALGLKKLLQTLICYPTKTNTLVRNLNDRSNLTEILAFDSWLVMGLIKVDNGRPHLTAKGYECIQLHAKTLVEDATIPPHPIAGSLTEKYYQNLADYIQPDLWANILPSIDAEISTYFAEILRRKDSSLV